MLKLEPTSVTLGPKPIEIYLHCLQKILDLTSKDRVPGTEMLRRAGCINVAAINQNAAALGKRKPCPGSSVLSAREHLIKMRAQEMLQSP